MEKPNFDAKAVRVKIRTKSFINCDEFRNKSICMSASEIGVEFSNIIRVIESTGCVPDYWKSAISFRDYRNDKRSIVKPTIREAVFLRDGAVCRYCGDIDGPFHLDHIYPWSRGGEDTEENLCVSCQSCNLSKSNKLVNDWGGRS